MGSVGPLKIQTTSFSTSQQGKQCDSVQHAGKPDDTSAENMVKASSENYRVFFGSNVVENKKQIKL